MLHKKAAPPIKHDFIIPAESAGLRLDKFVADQFNDVSRERVQDLIRGQLVRVNGMVKKPSYKLGADDHITADIQPLPAPSLVAQDIPLEILFEDKDLIVVNKPAGLVVHPADGTPDNTLVNALLHHTEGNLSAIGNEGLRPGIVHRLDKDTSGVLVAAKSDKAYLYLQKQFADHTIERRYKAVVWGMPLKMQHRIETQMGRHPQNRKKMSVLKRGGKTAITKYQLETTFKGAASLLDVMLETGRTHQIRVHLSHLGHALVGDPVYGRTNLNKHKKALKTADIEDVDFILQFSRQALHAYKLAFTHPSSGQHIDIETKVPHDMAHLLTCLSGKKLAPST